MTTIIKRSTDLQHEPLDNPVEPASLIAQLGPALSSALVAQTEVQKVVGRLGYDVLEEFKDDPAGWARVDGDVKVRARGRVGHGWLMCYGDLPVLETVVCMWNDEVNGLLTMTWSYSSVASRHSRTFPALL